MKRWHDLILEADFPWNIDEKYCEQAEWMMLFSSVLAFANHASNAIMCRIDGVFRIVCLHHVEQIGDDHVHAVHIESQLIQRLVDGLISLMAEFNKIGSCIEDGEQCFQFVTGRRNIPMQCDPA